jgi:hypothetical protein
MQTINIEGFGPMNFPDEMTQDEIKTAIDTKILPSLQQKEESPTDRAYRLAQEEAAKPTPEGGFKAAVRSSLERVQGDIAGVAGRTGAVDIGAAEKFKTEKEQRASEIFQGTEDGWLESPWTKFKETLGQSAGYMLAPIVAGAGATLLGASAPISLTAAGLASLAQFTGTNLSRQMQEKGLGLADTDLLSAGAAAVPQAALDVVSLRMLPGINRIFRSAGKELSEDQLKAIAQRNLLTNVGMSGGKIAGVEGLTEVGQQFLERLQAGISTTDAEARDEYIESLIGGAVLGGTFGGVAGVGARGRAQRKLEGIEGERAFQEEEKARAEQAAVTPEGAAPTAPTDFLTSEEARIQKQRAGLERFGETADFPSEISPAGTQTREERQLAAQAGIDAAETSAPSASIQGDLFLDAAQRARAEGAPIAEQQRLMDVGAVPTTAAPAPAPIEDLFDAQGNKLAPGSPVQAYDAYGTPVSAPSAVPAGQGALPLVGGRTQEQQIIEMYAADQNAQAVTNARAKQAERVALGEQGVRAAEQERLKFESDLAATDARIQQTRERTTEDNRLGLLLPLVADTNVANIPKAFGRALQAAGFTDTQFTPRERELIQRAYDVRVAEDVRTPEDNPEARRYGTPNEMDVYKPARAQEPQQIGLPGFAAPKGTRPAAPEPEVVEAPEKAVVGQEQVDFLFLPAASAVRKNILNKDVADPEQRQYVATQLKAARDAFAQKTDPRSRTAVKRINDILSQSPFVRTQGEMFGPRGGVLPQPKAPKQEVKDVDKRTTAESTAKPGASKPPVGVGGVGVGTGAAGKTGTGGVPKTGKRGLADTGGGAKSDDTGAKVAPVTVKKLEVKKPVEAKKPEAKKPEAKKPAEKAVGEKSDNKKAETKAVSAFDTMVGQLAAGPKLESTGKVEPTAEKQKIINAFDLPLDRPPTGIGKEAGDKEALSRALSRTGRKKLSLEEAIGEDLPSDVQGALKDGNLSDALDTLAANTSGIVNRILRALSRVAGDTKVKVVDNLKDASGKPVPGMFDPETNTIMLDSKTGLNNHTLMHETTHSALSHVLDNPNHPVTKQLTALFNSVKPLLDTAYGATNVQEFVAEAWGNPEFRAKLSGMNPDGTNISALQKFVNTVANFMRRMVGMDSKSITSAFDAADELMSAIISPAPETRNADAMYLASARGMGDKVLDAAGRVASSLPGMNQERADKFDEFFRGAIPNSLKGLVRMSLPLNALIDTAKQRISTAVRIGQVIDDRAGAEDILRQKVEATIRNVSGWAAKQSREKLDNFNDVIYTSTYEQVDPSKSREKYKGDAEKLKAWDALQPKWIALGAGGQATYNRMRDSYANLYDRIGDILKTRINDEMGDKASAKVVNEALRKIYEGAGKIEPYFPLTRQGEYRISYKAFSPRTNREELFVRHFTTKVAQERAIVEVKKEGATDVQVYKSFDKIDYRSAPTGSFMNSILKTLEVNKVSDTTTEEIMRLFMDVMPETSFAQSLRSRQNREGFDLNAIGAMETRMYSIARQLTNLEYGAKLSKARADMLEEVKSKGSDPVSVDLARELSKRVDFALSPIIPKWSQIATSIGFNMTLGLNVSSAIVNLTQVPLVVLPYLGGRYGLGDTTRALGNASRVFMNSGRSRTSEDLLGEKVKVKAAPSLDNYDWDKVSADMKKYQTLSEEGRNSGLFNRSMTYDILDMDNSPTILNKVNAVSGFVFHHGERMNRQVALIAAYDLELARMKKKPTAAERNMTQKEREVAAAKEAIYLTELLNGGTSAAAAPRIAQNGIGKVMFMFKRYGVSMYYLLFKTAGQALSRSKPEGMSDAEWKDTRHAARKQLAGIFGSAALISGARGLPMFGMAALAYDMFKDDDEDDFRTASRKWLGETAYAGGLNAITGLEISSRVGLSDLLFRDSNVKKDQSAILSLLEAAGGPVVGIASRVERGIKLIGEGNTARGIEQILPSAISNGLKSVRFASEGTTTLRGDPIVGEVNAWNVGAQAFGFAPAEYTRQLEINASEKGNERRIVQQKTKMLREYYVAARMGDSGEMSDVMERIIKFNSKHPGVAITGDTISRSMKQHARTSAEMYHGVTFNKRLRPEIMQSIQEYE